MSNSTSLSAAATTDATPSLRSDKLKLKNLQLCDKELKSYLKKIASLPNLSNKKKTMQSQIPMIQDCLFRLSRLVTPSEYFQRILLVGDFCLENRMYTIGIKEFYDRIFAEKRLIDLTMESSENRTQFQQHWMGIYFHVVLNRAQCMFYEIVQLDNHLLYQDKRKELFGHVFSIQELIDQHMEHYQLLKNHIFNAVVVSVQLIGIIQQAGMWKESVALLANLLDLLLVRIPEVPGMKSAEADHVILLARIIRLLFEAHEQLSETAPEDETAESNPMENLLNFLTHLRKKFDSPPKPLEPHQKLISEHIISYLDYQIKRIQSLHDLSSADQKDATGSKSKGGKKGGANTNADPSTSILETLQLIPAEQEAADNPPSYSANDVVSRVVQFVYPNDRSFFRHQLPSQKKFDTMVAYLDFTVNHIQPYLSLYRKYFGIDALESDVPITRDMFSPDKQQENTAQDSKKGTTKGGKSAKGKSAAEEPEEEPITPDDIRTLYEANSENLSFANLFSLCKMLFHYNQWKHFDSLHLLLRRMMGLDKQSDNKTDEDVDIKDSENQEQEENPSPADESTQGEELTKSSSVEYPTVQVSNDVHIYSVMMDFLRQIEQESGIDIETRERLIQSTVNQFHSKLLQQNESEEEQSDRKQLFNSSKTALSHPDDDLADAALILSQWTKKYFFDESPQKQVEILAPFFHILQLLNVKNLTLLCELGIRLALFLEQQDRLGRALFVIRHCLQQVCVERSLILYNEPVANSEFSVLEDTEHQSLYCLHAELVSHIFRMELKRGIQKKTNRLEKTRKQELQDLTKRKENPHLFGKLYDRDIQTMRTLSVPVEKPLNNKKHEESLLKSAGQNFYELALANMLISNFRDESKDKREFIRKSIEYLLSAESYEKKLVSQSNSSSEDTRVVLVKPSSTQLLIKVRSQLGSNSSQQQQKESVDLLDDDPIDFVVFGKQQNFGESAVTAADRELVGTGSKWDPNQNVLISELEPNQFFSFATQQVDQYGEAIEKISANSMRFATMFPLPLVLCWCYITQTAHKIGSFSEALQSGVKVLEPYLSEQPSKPLWELNPIKQLSLDPKMIRAKASKLLIREIIKCAEIIGDIQLKREKIALPEDCPPQLGPNQLKRDISRMKICNYYLMSLHLAEQIQDSATIRNLTIKIHQTLAPLLSTGGQNQQSQFLLDSLVFVSDALVHVTRKHYRSHELQQAVSAILLSSVHLSSSLSIRSHLQKIASNFYKIVAKIYEGCEKDEKNPKSMSPEMTSLIEALFLNPIAAPSLLENKPSNPKGIDEIFFKVAESLNDPAEAINQLNAEYRDHKLHPRLTLLLIKEQMRQDKLSINVSSKLFSGEPAVEDPAPTKKGKSKAAPVEEVQPTESSEPQPQKIEQTDLELICAQVEFNKLITGAGTREAEKDEPAAKGGKKKAPPKQTGKGKKKAAAEEPEEPSEEEKQAKLLEEQREKSLKQKLKFSALRLYPCCVDSQIRNVFAPTKEERVPDAENTTNDANTPTALVSLFEHFTNGAKSAVEFKQWKELFNFARAIQNTFDSLLSSVWNQDGRVEKADISAAQPSVVEAFTTVAQGFIAMLNQIREGDSVDSNMLAQFSEYENAASNEIASHIEYDNVSRTDPMGYELPWVDRLVDIDLREVESFVHFVLRLLSLIGGDAAVLEQYAQTLLSIGSDFNSVTNNYFAAHSLPLMIDARDRISADSSDLISQAQIVEKDRPKTLVKIEESRHILEQYFSDLLTASASGDDTAIPTLESVIANYESTASLLRSKHEVPLLVQALNELGDLYYLESNHEKAAFLWAEALDNCLNTVTTLDNFQEYVIDKNGGKILHRYGFWNVTTAIIVAAKLGRHKMRHEKDYHSCTKASVLISELVLALFSFSAQHPQRFCDFANYDAKFFVDGIFSDSYRCIPSQFIEAIQFAAQHLNKNRQYLRSLPVCTLYEFLAHRYLRDVSAVTDARLLKANSLSEMGQMEAAFEKLRTILLGRNLPVSHINELGVELAPTVNRVQNAPQVFQDETRRLYQERSLDNESNQETIRQLTQSELKMDGLQSVYTFEDSARISLTFASFMRKIGGIDPSRCIKTTGDAAVTTNDKKGKGKKGTSKDSGTSPSDDILQVCLQTATTVVNSHLESTVEDDATPQNVPLDLRLQFIHELAKITHLRGEVHSSQVHATRALQEAIDAVNKGAGHIPQLSLETIFDLHLHVAQIAFDNGFFRHCRTLCNSSIVLCDNTKEYLRKRYFELLRALSNHYLEVENAKETITHLAQTDAGFQELDDLFVPRACTELGHLYELESLFEMPQTWKSWLSKKGSDEAQRVSAAESFYKLAADFLDRYLYDNGFFESVPENHELLRENVLVRNEAKDLLMRSKFKIGVILMVRGEYQNALKYMESVDRVLGQCFGASSSLRANFKLAFGRLHRHLINTPHNVEDLWGTKKMSSTSFTAEVLQNDKAELTFLPPTKRLEDALNQAFAHSFHDHTLLRRIFMELCYLYGCKIVHDTTVHSAHVLIALIYLLAACRVTSMRNILENKRRQLLLDSGRDLSDAPPTFLAEAVEAHFKNVFNAQFEFFAQNSLDEVNHLAKGATQDAKNVMEWFVGERALLHASSPSEQRSIETKLFHTHKYLLRSCSAYASEILMTSIPDLKTPPSIGAGLVCMQFFCIDTGLYPERVSSSKQLSLAEKLAMKKEDVTMPLVSLFYAITGQEYEDGTLPLMGMLSFEQELIEKMQEEFLALRDRMEELNVDQIEERDEDADTDVDASQIELQNLKQKALEKMIHLLTNPSAITRKTTTADTQALISGAPSMNTSLIDRLCAMFDPQGGIYVPGGSNTELSEWLRKILSVYH